MRFFRPQDTFKVGRRAPERVGNVISVWFSLVHSDPNKESLTLDFSTTLTPASQTLPTGKDGTFPPRISEQKFSIISITLVSYLQSPGGFSFKEYLVILHRYYKGTWL